MKINPNYQLRTFNYSKINNQPLQTNPSFGNKNKFIQEGAKAAAGAIAAGTVLAMQNGKDNENKIPTREEFQNMLKYVTTKEEVDKWLEVYDHNPQNAIVAFFTGNVDTETDTGVYPFLLSVANSIIPLAPYISEVHINGIRSMLQLKDEMGNFRFNDPKDYICAAGVFGKYPEIATQYANEKDNGGNYRFSADTIRKILQNKTSGAYPPEKIDEFMNLQRPDGSYVNKEFYWSYLEMYMENPEAYKELCNISLANGEYIYIFHIPNIIKHYLKYPDEIKEILQTMPQFSIEDLTPLGTRAGINLKIAPKSFRALADIKISDKNAFSLQEICDIIYDFELGKKEANNPEEFEATLKMLSVLGKLEKDSYTRYLNLEHIFEASKIYKKYPKETVDIIKNYYRTPECDVLIPTEDDITLYKENRSEFNKKYQLK